MKARIENWLLGHLFNAVSAREIVSNDPKTGAVLVEGSPIQPSELRQLQAEIKALEGFRIWKLMSGTCRHHAEERIFRKSVSIEDVRFGKAMLYNLGVQKSIMDALRERGS